MNNIHWIYLLHGTNFLPPATFMLYTGWSDVCGTVDVTCATWTLATVLKGWWWWWWWWTVSSRRYQLISRSPNSRPLYYIIRTSSPRIRLIHNLIYIYMHIAIDTRTCFSEHANRVKSIYNTVLRARCIKSPWTAPSKTHTHTHMGFLLHVYVGLCIYYTHVVLYICIGTHDKFTTYVLI